MKSAKQIEAKPTEAKPTAADLEQQCDMAVIEYFTALDERDKLQERLNLLERITLPDLSKKFQRAKVAHLLAKHGMADKAE